MQQKKQFDFIIFIGRFQPFHNGHKQVLDKALNLAEKVIILVGSSNQPRTIKNPFSFDERKEMINKSCGENYSKLMIAPLRDQQYNDQLWAGNVQQIVETELIKSLGWQDGLLKGGIIGHSKDESSYYLKMFPQWDLIEHSINEDVHATDIRKIYFESNLLYLKAVIPEPVSLFLTEFKKTGEYSQLVKEQEFINKYKKAWEAAPYAPTFLTSDAVVIQSGHILLIKRNAEPGKGLWALPGGFINQNERIEDGMIRELKEETKLKVPVPVLKGSIKSKEVFDKPDRSLRGRTVTYAYHIELPAGELPVVKGSDDASKAKWIPLSHIREEELFEDHFAIIQFFVGKL